MRNACLTMAVGWMLFLAGEVLGRPELRVGIAGHAFDHLGAIGEQAESAIASGANIIYATGVGGLGYQGLPTPEKLAEAKQASGTYHERARSRGVRLVMGYLCATSMVGLEEFDKNWPPDLRRRFGTGPAAWRQQDRHGKVLPSWYGGKYEPACMNHPDWRAYGRFMVSQQLEAGCDGIFFDNPTVHPQGCYCEHCMKRFSGFLEREKLLNNTDETRRPKSVSEWRDFAAAHPAEFMRFRCTIARDFLREMRESAREVNGRALITCNNSFNSPGVLFSQCRSYAYNIHELSQAEDYIVVEDMATQPRMLGNGQTLEYGPSYKQIHAISHGKPLVAVTLAEADYHTPPRLVRLAMAEAAANDASYLAWPTWPESVRGRMASAIRPQAEFLRQNEKLLNGTRPRRDAILFLPFRRWIETDKCVASHLAAELTKANIQYEVLSEDELISQLRARTRGGQQQCKLLVVESRSVFTREEAAAVKNLQRAGGTIIAANERPDWIRQVEAALARPSLVLRGSPALRASVRDQPGRTIIHLLNLNVERVSSFEDKVQAASEVFIRCRVPFARVRSVSALTADEQADRGPLKFSAHPDGTGTLIEATVGKVEIATMVVVER